jgi:4-hydroxyphenylpyruvate dioxygenase
MSSTREALVDSPNPLQLDGIEFIEYATSKPQALGQVLEVMGFRPVARHRSREVLLYRQGDRNVISSRIYFVDRYTEFSIYDVDFVPIPTVDPQPPELAGLHWFGVVQYVGLDRINDWIEFYGELFGFQVTPAETHFGVLHAGRILRSPCGKFFVQLIEPLPDLPDDEAPERFERVGLGTADIPAAMAELRQRGVTFAESHGIGADARGAITETWLGGVWFELVHDER